MASPLVWLTINSRSLAPHRTPLPVSAKRSGKIAAGTSGGVPQRR
jgi:hypothetical protein